jgi:tRNA U34 5-carboxymethylaminomethyl modifying enzyme MnmG/GidA
MDDKEIPASIDFAHVPSLRLEARQKLSQIRPATLGQAARISGISPADISSLTVWLRRAAQAESSASVVGCAMTSQPDDDPEDQTVPR